MSCLPAIPQQTLCPERAGEALRCTYEPWGFQKYFCANSCML